MTLLKGWEGGREGRGGEGERKKNLASLEVKVRIISLIHLSSTVSSTFYPSTKYYAKCFTKTLLQKLLPIGCLLATYKYM